MALLKITSEQLSEARRAGFKSKAPKKPKQSASVKTLENYVVRYNNWVKKAKAKATKKKTDASKKNALKKAIWC